MSNPYMGEIRPLGFNFAPRGWAMCDGQILPINTYQALFSLLGTTYGGDGRTSFALPDLRGRTPVHPGTGSGLPTVNLGERGGAENVTLTAAQIPSHNHTVHAEAQAATVTEASGAYLAEPSDNQGNIIALYRPSENLVDMSSQAVSNSGGSQSHNNMQPFLTLNFCICLQGLFPSRN